MVMFCAITGENEVFPAPFTVRIQQRMRRTWQEVLEDEAANHIIHLYSISASF
jgi:hypothetical protein